MDVYNNYSLKNIEGEELHFLQLLTCHIDFTSLIPSDQSRRTNHSVNSLFWKLDNIFIHFIK